MNEYSPPKKPRIKYQSVNLDLWIIQPYVIRSNFNLKKQRKY